MRRFGPILSTLLVLLLTMAVFVPRVAAQDDEATMSHQHPLVGAWLVELDYDADGQPDGPGLAHFDADGAFSGVGPQGPLLGAWDPTGDRSADVTFHAIASAPGVGVVGLVTLRIAIEAAEDGQGFTGSFTQELPSAMAEMMGAPQGELGPGQVTGQRIVVQAPGEAVGPIPDPRQQGGPQEG